MVDAIRALPGQRLPADGFNLSHSENRAALAVSNGIEIGIDVEIVRPFEDSLPVEVFSTRERAQCGLGIAEGDRVSVGSEHQHAVDEAGDQRPFRPHHHEVDSLALGECQQPIDVIGGDGNALGFPRDSGVSGRAEQLVAERRSGNRPAQRVFAPARPHDKNPQFSTPRW